MTSRRFERARLQPRRETSSQSWALAPEGRGLPQFLFPILHRRVPHPCLSTFWRDRLGNFHIEGQPNCLSIRKQCERRPTQKGCAGRSKSEGT